MTPHPTSLSVPLFWMTMFFTWLVEASRIAERDVPLSRSSSGVSRMMRTTASAAPSGFRRSGLTPFKSSG
ncbi:hypothetical protein V5F32_01345 [Xanthobacter oligotrophicus]|uniref:Secreted protein n=1 Tax=Xanthobacter oligotrophicus TaxID=2607286 RepID=A0ABW6ZSG6_9HYPH